MLRIASALGVFLIATMPVAADDAKDAEERARKAAEEKERQIQLSIATLPELDKRTVTSVRSQLKDGTFKIEGASRQEIRVVIEHFRIVDTPELRAMLIKGTKGNRYVEQFIDNMGLKGSPKEDAVRLEFAISKGTDGMVAIEISKVLKSRGISALSPGQATFVKRHPELFPSP